MLFFPADFELNMSTLQLVPGGLMEQAVPRNATASENTPLAVTPKQGAVSVRLHTAVHGVRKVEALYKMSLTFYLHCKDFFQVSKPSLLPLS